MTKLTEIANVDNDAGDEGAAGFDGGPRDERRAHDRAGGTDDESPTRRDEDDPVSMNGQVESDGGRNVTDRGRGIFHALFGDKVGGSPLADVGKRAARATKDFHDQGDTMTGDSNEEPGDAQEALDELEARADILHIITQPTRRNLLVAIYTHPRKMPSRAELAFMSPDISADSESTVYRHMKQLTETGVVEEVEVEEDRQVNDLPHKFYTISDVGEEFLKKHGLVPERLDALREIYAAREKPEKIQRYEQAPRPGDPPVDTGDIDADVLAEVLTELQETGDAEAAAEKLMKYCEGEDGDHQSDSVDEEDYNNEAGPDEEQTPVADESHTTTARARLGQLIH